MPDNYNIYFWKYDHPSKGYRGFHLSADAQGCDILLNKLRSKVESPNDRSAKFELSKLTEKVLSVPNCKKRAIAWKHFEIFIDPNAREGFLTIQVVNDIAQVALSKGKAEELITGIEDIKAGNGDWAMSNEFSKDDGQCIWFWWSLER